MSTYSASLKIELIQQGDQTGDWGNTTNTNLGTAIEEAITGIGNASFSADDNLTLTFTDSNASQVARNLVLDVTSEVSLTDTRDLIVPTIVKQYLVWNNTTGDQDIVVKTAAGTGITVPNGRRAHLMVDGTNVIFAADTGGGGGATGGGSDEVFLETDQVVTTSYTITENKNAVSTGPLEIEDGVVVTVPSGSRWVVI